MARIKVFTRSFDLRLYRLAKGLFEGMTGPDGAAIPCVRLTDQTADGYFYTMLRDTDCDIAINIDEDAFMVDPQAVLDLVELVQKEGYANAGCSDGSEFTTGRDKVVTNPFFNILNLSLIRTKFERSAIPSQAFGDAEPYYPFFRWLAANFQTLYLPCERHHDGTTTIAKHPDGRPLCLHTWFSRFYSMPSWIVRRIDPVQISQKPRIDAIISEAYDLRAKQVPHFGLADNIVFAANKCLRWLIKVPQRISRWPWKLRRVLKSKN